MKRKYRIFEPALLRVRNAWFRTMKMIGMHRCSVFDREIHRIKKTAFCTKCFSPMEFPNDNRD